MLFSLSVSLLLPQHGGVQRKYGGKKFSKDMALLFAFYKSLPRHRAIKLNNRPINTLSPLVFWSFLLIFFHKYLNFPEQTNEGIILIFLPVIINQSRDFSNFFEVSGTEIEFLKNANC